MKAARAVADLSLGTILATVDIAVPRERVFRALTDPKELVLWWGSPESYRVTEATSDLRVGGTWRSAGTSNDGSAFVVEGEYLEIDPPRLLVHTWRAPWDGGHPTTVRYTLEVIEVGTRVTVRHDGFAGRPESCANHGAGWELVLGWLNGHLVKPEAARFFFCRLVSPRPTFPQDASPEELQLMREHAAYWRGHLADGTAVVFGPVADPAGFWGLGIFRVRDEQALTALQAQDPIIRANRGFSYANLPMAQAVTRS